MQKENLTPLETGRRRRPTVVKGNSSLTGLTLIELLIAILISSILVGTVVLTLKTCFAVYHFSQDEIFLQRILDETLEEVSTGGFEAYGVRDSLEILEASVDSIAFVPLWVDTIGKITVKPDTVIALEYPFKPGSSLPIAEISLKDNSQDTISEKWSVVPIAFILGSHKDPCKPDDAITLNEPLPSGAKLRVLYQPDSTCFPHTAMTLKWDKSKRDLLRIYKKQSETIPNQDLRGGELSSIEFQYFDNTNTLISLQTNGSVADELLAQITAVKVILEAQTKEKTKQGFCFVHLRNSRSSGAGTIIREGTRLKIPNSRQIKVFSLTNIAGVEAGDCINIEARPEKGTIWKIHIELGIKDGLPLITKYSVAYPPGLPLYFETINLTTDLPLSFLTLGRNGLYDYDFDDDTENIVDLKGEVELVVTRMDIAGATLFIRP